MHQFSQLLVAYSEQFLLSGIYVQSLLYVMTMVQITHNLNGTRVCAACAKAKNVWHQTMHVHVFKINAPNICTYPYEVSVTKRSSLQPVVL